VIDVSEAGDWSKVKVWYAPLRDVGSSTYPLYGFIYNKPAQGDAPFAAPKTRFALSNDIIRLASLEAATS
jgi:hypothetical protein